MIGIVTLWAIAELLLQEPRIERIDPPHWWANMGVDTLELLVEGTNLHGADLRIEATGVDLVESPLPTNPRYRYVRLAISPQAPAQRLRIIVGDDADTAEFELRRRQGANHRRTGLAPEDVMYLIMVDRFANGDTTNDIISGMREHRVDRRDPFGRHGGDLVGLRSKLGYLEEMGVTALWLCPVLENDQPRSSYHGYAITDHYAVDHRYGTVAEYRELAENLHDRGMRLVMDVVFNHVGDHHRLFREPPDSSWFNQWPTYTQTTGRENTTFDPYATEYDRTRFVRGWFDRSMPDVNTANRHAGRYLIQNTMWWIEEIGIDALRIDTYTYPDQTFMSVAVSELRTTFPDLFIFGETWVDSHASQAFYLEGFPFNPDSRLVSSTDFQVYTALRDVLTSPSGWDTGTGRLYRTLAADYLYESPNQLVTFLDNHDLPRIAGLVDRDVRKLRMGLALLLILRGIPCITYGTECGMWQTENHGVIRQDMPGGWPGESKPFGCLNDNQTSDFASWLKGMIAARRENLVFTHGSMKHIVPQDGVYAIMRYNAGYTVLCIINADSVQRSLPTLRLDDVLQGDRACTTVPEGASVAIADEIALAPYETKVLLFKRR